MSPQSTFGSIVDTAQNQAAVAVPGATIRLRSAEENTIETLVSDATGGLESFGGADDLGALTSSVNTLTGNAFADVLLGLLAKTYVARSRAQYRRPRA